MPKKKDDIVATIENPEVVDVSNRALPGLNWTGGCYLFPADVPSDALASAERMKMWLDGIGIVSMDRWMGDARIDYTGAVEYPDFVVRPLGCFFGDSFYLRKRCYDIMGILKEVNLVNPEHGTDYMTLDSQGIVDRFRREFPDTTIPMRPVIDCDPEGIVAGTHNHVHIAIDDDHIEAHDRSVAWDCAVAWLEYNDLLCEILGLYIKEQSA